MKQQFAHRCRLCGYRWFSGHHQAACLKCGSSRRETFKLVPFVQKRKIHIELALYGAIITLGLIGLLVR